MAHPEALFPIEPTLDNYITAWNSEDFNIGRMLWNSTYYTLICVAVTIFFFIHERLCFCQRRFPGKKDNIHGIFFAYVRGNRHHNDLSAV